MIDSHAHYDHEKFDHDRDAVINQVIEAGITHIMNAGCDIASSIASIALSQKFMQVYASVGVHPHEASTCDAHTLQTLEELAANEKVRAIGEIGLDYHYDFSPREVQKDWFAKQINLARKLKLPIIIHDRESHKDVLDIVRAEKGYEAGGVFHMFSGSVEMARDVLNMGFYLGIGGPLTFKNAVKPAEVVKFAPLDRLLIETDCPYMTPEPYRGQRNHSGYLTWILERIAAIRNITSSYADECTSGNARMLFHLS